MPIDQNGTLVPMMPHQVNVPVPDGSGFQISVQIMSDGTPGTEAAMDATLQDLVDYLQAWPGRRPDANVTGQKSEYRVFSATPTNPVVIDPPEEEPEGMDGPAPEPAPEA